MEGKGIRLIEGIAHREYEALEGEAMRARKGLSMENLGRVVPRLLIDLNPACGSPEVIAPIQRGDIMTSLSNM